MSFDLKLTLEDLTFNLKMYFLPKASSNMTILLFQSAFASLMVRCIDKDNEIS